MPKVTGTRKQEANTLLKRLAEGPSLSAPFTGVDDMTNDEIVDHFSFSVRLWLDTWITPTVERLVPELR